MKRNLRENDLFTVTVKTPTPGLIPGRLYAVLRTEMTGGGTGHGPHDVYPDGHEVTAVRLSPSHRPLKAVGRKIKFYQSGCFHGVVDPDHIKHLGTCIREDRFTIKNYKL